MRCFGTEFRSSIIPQSDTFEEQANLRSKIR